MNFDNDVPLDVQEHIKKIEYDNNQLRIQRRQLKYDLKKAKEHNADLIKKLNNLHHAYAEDLGNAYVAFRTIRRDIELYRTHAEQFEGQCAIMRDALLANGISLA